MSHIISGTVDYGFNSENSYPDFKLGDVEVIYNKLNNGVSAILRNSEQISQTLLWDFKAYLSEENIRDYGKLMEK